MGKRPDSEKDALEREEKRVADEIEETIRRPSSIEEEAMLEAAEIEELEFRQDRG